VNRIDDAIHWARQNHLDLRASREAVPIEAIDAPWHGPAFVSPAFITLFRGKEPWPVRMPLIVAACEQTECAIIDGNHRLTAAAQAGYKVIPIIALPRSTVTALVDRFRPDEESLWRNGFPFDEILGVFKASALVRENLEKEHAWEIAHRT
jgi:hypothetical protein